MVSALHYKIVSDDGTKNSLFGRSVSLDGDTALIGASSDNNTTGAAYVYIKSGGRWILQAKLTASDKAERSFFGSRVSLSGNTALIGAYGSQVEGVRSGAAYVFIRDGSGNWKQQAKLKSSVEMENNRFGLSVALSGNTALVGEYNQNEKVTGAAYIFVRDKQSRWTEQAKLLASNGKTSDFFGSSIALSSAGDTAVIGAHQVNESSGIYDSGAVYIFQRNGTGKWEQQAQLVSVDKVKKGFFRIQCFYIWKPVAGWCLW